MARKLLILLLLLALHVTPSYAGTRWINETEGEQLFGGWVKDVTGPRGKGYWAGKVTAIEINETEGGMTLTGNVKVQITWVTDRTSYECHQVYVMHNDDVEDFTHRSLMLRPCS